MIWAAVVVLGAAGWSWELWRPAPGESFSGTAPEVTPVELSLAERLAADVTTLSTEFGERTLRRHASLTAAGDWIAAELSARGLSVRRQELQIDGKSVHNIEAVVPGSTWPDELVVVGAHYDTVMGTPGANSNASGVAAVLALAEALGQKPLPRSMRFVFFTCGERPFMLTEKMGSLAWARAIEAAGQEVVAMLSLDSLGYFTDEPDSEHLPSDVAAWFPTVGNYLAVVGDWSSVSLANRVIGHFREVASVPSQLGLGLQSWDAVAWSDHWSFWQCGWPAIVITDTGPYRDPAFHRWNDTADRLDYETMARIVAALETVIEHLATDT
jgi:Zn-dependent M28 family amino/carboxypeptidase